MVDNVALEIRGSGQVCSSTSRVLVHQSLREPLLKLLKERIEQVKVGDALDAELMNHQGPTMVNLP